MLHLHGYYRLNKPTIAVERTEDEKKCFHVPEGATLLINGFEREGPLIEVLYAGHRLLMFEEDLLARTQAIGNHRSSNYVGKTARDRPSAE